MRSAIRKIKGFVKPSFIAGFLLLIAFQPSYSYARDFNSVVVQLGSQAGDVEKRIAHLLIDRLYEAGIQNVKLVHESERIDLIANDLRILMGMPDHHKYLKLQFEKYRIPELTDLAPGPEGFLLQFIHSNKESFLISAGVDERACLYAVGEFLRQVKIRDGELSLPEELNIRTAPAFEIRGTQYGQSGVAKRLAHVRDWTEAETQRVILDYALAGANIFSTDEGPMFDFIKSYGLMTQGAFGANTAGRDIPEEWIASESIGRIGYACLSVPEARAFMLKKCEDYFRSSPSFDLVKFHGGDGGGCECDRCDPYGLTFIKLVEEMAAIIHSYHPESRVYFTNQKFDNDDDNAIFQYLNEKDRDWLWAWGYGPGSDATTWQPGHRQTHRMDLFRYPGFGPYGLYPQEILHQIPARHDLVYYNEITHWKYAQHAYIQMYPRSDRNGDLPLHWSHDIYERRPDQYLTMVYNRQTFYAWPRYYHRVFNDLMRYGVGDITHSSGHHDHFNQWMWQRLLWAPRMTVEQVVDEYCKYWFGDEASQLMSQALFQLEENIEEDLEFPLDQKSGIDSYYKLVKKAGEIMPSELMKENWLWRMYMQKAAIDKYVQLKVKQQKEFQDNIENKVGSLLTGHKTISIKDLLTEFSPSSFEEETPEMAELRMEAEQLGSESNDLFGVRNDGIYNLQHDFIGLAWLERQLERAENASKKDRLNLLEMIADYENPGEGGFYDNLGTSNNAPNVIFGYPYDHGQPYVSDMLSEGNRPSQRSMHFTQDEVQGVSLEYTDLDPEAKYSIQFTFVRPWYQARYADRMNQKSQSIYADDQLLVEEVELPLQMSDFFNFDIPSKLTKDGELVIRLKHASNVAQSDRVAIEQWRNSGGWGTIVSEVWLIKK